MKKQNIIFLIIGLITIITICGLTFQLLLKPWYKAYKEIQVQEHIHDNFYTKYHAFQEFLPFVNSLPPLDEIEFKDNMISSYISSDSLGSFYRIDTFSVELHLLDINVPNCDNFEFLDNQLVKINCADTTIYTYSWTWHFEGNQKHERFQDFLKVTHLWESEFEALKEHLENLNCQTISKERDGKIQLIYDGHSGYNYSYFINYKQNDFTVFGEDYRHLTHLDSNFTCGRYWDILYKDVDLIFSK